MLQRPRPLWRGAAGRLRKITVDDVFRLFTGLFMLWLAYTLDTNPDRGTASFIIRQGWSIHAVIIAIAGGGAALLLRRWRASMFFLITSPLLAYSGFTSIYTYVDKITPVAAGYQVFVFVLMVVFTFRLAEDG